MIFEQNEDTPLFAAVAENRFENGEIETAKKILEKGIEKYPDYATPYFVLAKILIAEGDKEKATEILEKGKKIYNYPLINAYFERLLDDESLLAGEKESNPILEQLNEEILPEKQSVEAEDDDLASETLAEVYESQGAFKEAIEIYEKLISKEPENADKYRAKIEELTQKL